MIKLSVNVNKVALLRNTRKGEVPDVVNASRIALDAGAAGITVHPRPDQRHIRSYDVDNLANLLAEPTYVDREYNIEGNPFLGEYMDHARRVQPTQCTLVPDTPGQSTSDHGWDIAKDGEKLKPIIEELQSYGCRVSLFMDPDLAAIEQVPDTGADRIELYTEGYAVAFEQGGDAADHAFNQYAAAAKLAADLGLGVNGGHDLNLLNLPRFARIAEISEVSIGHALIADALVMGMAETVKAYLRALGK